MRFDSAAVDALDEGLRSIRDESRLPEGFPAQVDSAAAEAAARDVSDGRTDRTSVEFVTLDPASSTDLDQAFAIERSGADLLLHYAIADVAFFVHDGDALDAEAWRRGVTVYLPAHRAPLYPPSLSQGAASLLPDGPRPAVVFTVRVDPDGDVSLDGCERALVRSRAKLGYETVEPSDLPNGFADLARRIASAEARRGSSQSGLSRAASRTGW